MELDQVQVLAAIAAFYAKTYGHIQVTDEFMREWSVHGSQLFIARNEPAMCWDVSLKGDIIDGEVVDG